MGFWMGIIMVNYFMLIIDVSGIWIIINGQLL